MKRAFLRTLAVLSCVGVMGVSAYADEPAGTRITNLVIDAEDVNVTVVFSQNNAFAYDYDESRVALSAVQSGSTMKIEVDPNNDESYAGMITISIPNLPYEKVEVNAERTGMSLPELNANLDVDVDMGALSFTVPAAFDKTIDCEIVGSSTSIVIDKAAKDYLLTAKMTSVAPSFPTEWSAWPWHGDYLYETGNGNGKINLEIENSSLAITVE